jgi:alpha-L-fucosidase
LRSLTVLSVVSLGLALASSEHSAAGDEYKATRESISTHAVPEWFEDAKFGMFIDWGLYSVAGWAPVPEKGATYPDWYVFRMYTDDRFKEYHAKTWGPKFTRDDFIPLFTAKAYDPDKLAQIAKDSGMRYVVPFCKHHDGFCLWPSQTTGRNAGEMGPKRDLIRPLVDACHRDGLKFGFYQSLEEWEYPLIGQDGKPHLRLWDTKSPGRVVPYDAEALKGKIAGKRPVRDFTRDYLVPQTEEFIDRYDPDILWFDGDWTEDAETFNSYEMVAHFYNHASGRKEVVVNDRLGKTRSKVGDFYTSEYGAVHGKPFDLASGLRHTWEECRGISQSFGYNRQDNEKSIISGTQLIQMLANIVAYNGNLLLIVNLDGDGALPELEANRLAEIGKWLKVNGEAIYSTRPWQKAADGDRIRFTRSKDGSILYAICFDWPKHLVLHGVSAEAGSQVQMLGTDAILKSHQEGQDLAVDVPEELEKSKPCDHAYVLKIRLGK